MKKEEINNFIIDEVDDIIYLTDVETSEIIFMNRKACELMDLTEESQWKNKPCYNVLRHSDKPCKDCPDRTVIENGHYECERYNDVLDMYLYKKYKIINYNGRIVKLCVATDVTDIHKASDKLQKQLEVEKTFVSCIKTLYENKNMEAAINKLLSIIADYHQAERAYIFEIDAGGEKIINNTYEWCREGITSQIKMLQNVDISVIDRWMEQFERKGEFFITSIHGEVNKSSEEYRILEEQGIESLMAAPLKIDGKFAGFLGVDNPSANTDTLLLMQSVAAFVINDIQRKKNNARLYDLSYRDILTGVGNRHAYVRFMEQLEHAGKEVGIIFVDINGLKEINDMYGHERGDKLIREVAQVLRSIFSTNIFRVGGDEFVVFCTKMTQAEFESKIEKLHNSWKPDANASTGYIWHESGSIEEHVAMADKLMYRNKREYYNKCK